MGAGGGGAVGYDSPEMDWLKLPRVSRAADTSGEPAQYGVVPGGGGKCWTLGAGVGSFLGCCGSGIAGRKLRRRGVGGCAGSRG
jgi:hypothetical protein